MNRMIALFLILTGLRLQVPAQVSVAENTGSLQGDARLELRISEAMPLDHVIAMICMAADLVCSGSQELSAEAVAPATYSGTLDQALRQLLSGIDVNYLLLEREQGLTLFIIQHRPLSADVPTSSGLNQEDSQVPPPSKIAPNSERGRRLLAADKAAAALEDPMASAETSFVRSPTLFPEVLSGPAQDLYYPLSHQSQWLLHAVGERTVGGSPFPNNGTQASPQESRLPDFLPLPSKGRLVRVSGAPNGPPFPP